MTHFIFIQKNLFIKDLTYLVIYKIIRIYKLLIKIVIDQESLFTTKFWDNFMHILRISRDISTAYYLQTNDQTEYLNSLLK